MTPKNLDVIQEKIGYKFKEEYLLTQAFTRRSFAAENRNYEDNERLEFVGDKVLDFIVVKKLAMEHSFSDVRPVQSMESIEAGEKPSAANVEEKKSFGFAYSENEMTEIKKQIVQTSFLSGAIEALELEKYLIMGKGDVKMGVQNEPHVKEDLFEAIIGAVAIDSGWDIKILEDVVEKMLNLSYYIKNGVDDGIDYVSRIQDWHMKEYGKEPDYKYFTFGDEKSYECSLNLSGYSGGYFEGIGRSKKAATKIVAKRAYEFIKAKESDADRIMKVIGNFDFDSAVNKLQMLADKKLISGVEYLFEEQMPTDKSNGNPTWMCQCRIGGVDDHVEYGATTKTQAKKLAAYEMLSILVGRQNFSEFFKNKGIMVI